MKGYIVDTNVILRLLLNDIATQAVAAEELFRKAQKDKITITIPILVFVELVFTLSKFYGFARSKVANELISFAELSYLDIEKRELLLFALNKYAKTQVSFVDLIIHAEAEDSGKELFTFDKKFTRLSLK